MWLSISKIPKTKFDDLLHEHGLQRSSITFNLPLDGATDIPAFHWGMGSEASQADRCIEWFQMHIPLPDGVKYYSAFGESDLLTTSLASSRMILKGTTDIVVADKPYIDCRNVPSGMRIVIELKKSVGGMSPVVQATAKLLAASAVSNFPVVVLLTDLKNHWQFAWSTKREVVDCTFGRLKGSVLLKILATGPATPAPEDQVTPPAPYEKRCTLRSIYGYKV